MHLDHALGQREPDVQASGAPSAALILAERVKDLRQVLRVDADAVVFDRNHKVVPLARCRQLDVAAAVGILGGIGEQVGEHLPQAHRVGLKPRLVRQVDRQLVSALLERRPHHLDRALDRVAQLYGLLLDLELFLRNAGDVEQVVEQPRDGVEVGAHHPHHVVGALVAGFQQFQPREQRRERVADLVGQYGDKVRLGLVLRTSLLDGELELADVPLKLLHGLFALLGDGGKEQKNDGERADDQLHAKQRRGEVGAVGYRPVAEEHAGRADGRHQKQRQRYAPRAGAQRGPQQGQNKHIEQRHAAEADIRGPKQKHQQRRNAAEDEQPLQQLLARFDKLRPLHPADKKRPEGEYRNAVAYPDASPQGGEALGVRQKRVRAQRNDARRNRGGGEGSADKAERVAQAVKHGGEAGVLAQQVGARERLERVGERGRGRQRREHVLRHKDGKVRRGDGGPEVQTAEQQQRKPERRRRPHERRAGAAGGQQVQAGDNEQPAGERPRNKAGHVRARKRVKKRLHKQSATLPQCPLGVYCPP